MLVGRAVVGANRFDPADQALAFDLTDDALVGRIELLGVERLAEARRGKYVLQAINCLGDGRRIAEGLIVRIGQRCGNASTQ